MVEEDAEAAAESEKKQVSSNFCLSYHTLKEPSAYSKHISSEWKRREKKPKITSAL